MAAPRPAPSAAAPIRGTRVDAYRIPTEVPESDGTLAWDATVLVLVRIDAADETGLGYTYADRATAVLIADRLAPLLEGMDGLAVGVCRAALQRSLRNLGVTGIAAMALSAVDCALWDLRARLLRRPLATLLGQARAAIPIYGSGGFTSYDTETLRVQLRSWADAGCAWVKMKVGRDPDRDIPRVGAAREAIDGQAGLFVDANGAYHRKQALQFAEAFAQFGVEWFEEPVSSDDLDGLRLLRDRAPAGMAISAGEYGYGLAYFRRMLEAGAVDVLQVDATRAGGVSGFMEAAALCAAHGLPLSSHCAPALHLPLCCAAPAAIHLEYFHDHARIERLLFDGVVDPHEGRLAPRLDAPGLGLAFRDKDAECYRL